jgi:formate dehydrogenase major subunit
LNFVQINDEDAKLFKIKDGDKVKIDSRRGSITAKASVSSKIKKGVIFVPFHYADSPANMLTNPKLDAKAKIPEFKACAAKIIKV